MEATDEEKALNPTMADFEATLRRGMSTQMREELERRHVQLSLEDVRDAVAEVLDIVANDLEELSWAGIIRGAVEDLDVDEVVFHATGKWPEKLTNGERDLLPGIATGASHETRLLLDIIERLSGETITPAA